MSLAAPLRTAPAARGPLPLIVGIAVRDQLESLCRRHRSDVTLEIKWPNDVLLNGCKVAGILCEQALPAVAASPSPPPAILGIGVNANLRVTDLGPDLRTPAASLRETLAHRIDLDALAASISLAVAEEIEGWDRDGVIAPTIARVNDHLAWRGRLVELHAAAGQTAGDTRFTLTGVDETGRLTGIDESGRHLAFDAGDIQRLAPCDDHTLTEPMLSSA